MRKVLVAATGLCVAGLVTLVLAELLFRALPVMSSMGAQPVTAERPVFHFAPNSEFTYSRHWNMALARRGHINNAGFVNDRDYSADAPGPLMAVIGDSYVEAAMIPADETFHGRLAGELGDRGRIYSFGASGAPLSQYLVWADHVRRTYAPDAMAVLVIGNDFDESLLAYKSAPGFHYFAPDGDGTLRLTRVDYVPGRIGIVRSAFARYLLLNLQAYDTLNRVVARLRGEPGAMAFAGNVPVRVDDRRLADSMKATDAFLRDLPEASGLPPERLVLMVDGLHDIADAGPGYRETFFWRMRTYLAEQARRRGFEVVDLQPHLDARARATGRAMDLRPIDGHWSAEGHAVAAEALRETAAYRRIFGPE